jgi:hypothetical protein
MVVVGMMMMMMMMMMLTCWDDHRMDGAANRSWGGSSSPDSRAGEATDLVHWEIR